MKKYRVKTEGEFLKMYGDNWRYSVGESFVIGMDFLLGANLYSEENIDAERCISQGDYSFRISREGHGSYLISSDMLVELGVYGIISTIEKKYRFKKESEFVNEHGVTWRENVHWNGAGDMDYLFDRELSEDENRSARRVLSGRDYDFRLDSWQISANMLKELNTSYTTLNENLIKRSKKILLDQYN